MLLSEGRYAGCHSSCHLGCRFHAIAAPEARELAALEDENMATIEKVYQRFRDDNEIQAHIRQIKAHLWVQVVES